MREVIAEQGGFRIKPTEQYLEKQARELRISARQTSPKSNPTNKDIMEMLQDISERQGEIYDLLKK